MIKLRRNSILLLVLLASISLAFAYGCNGSGKTNVILVDFSDEVNNINYGEEYYLPIPLVSDEAGNKYKVEYEIKTSDGETVRPYYSKIIADINVGKKYIIHCNAIITEKASITRTITLEVIDTVKPMGEFVNKLVGEVNKEYVLPTAKLSDNVPHTAVEITSKILKDSEGTEIEITDGKFTPTTEGEYNYRVDFKDIGGNTNYISEKIFIRNAVVGRYLFDDFANAYSTTIVKTVENGMSELAAEYRESFDEKTGVVVVKSTESKTGPKYYLKINRTYEQLVALNIEYVYFRMKLTFSGTSVGYFNAVGLYKGNCTLDQWIDFKITKAEIENENSYFMRMKNTDETAWEAFCRMATSNNGVLMFDVYDTDGTEENATYTLYLDEFGYQGVFVPEKLFADEYVLGDEVELKTTVFDLENYIIKNTVLSPDGQTVELSADNKLRALQMGKYRVHSEIEHETETGSADFTFIVKSDNGAEIILENYKSTYGIDETIKVPKATCTVNNEQKTVKYKVVDESGYSNYITIENDEFNAEYYGDFNITYTAAVGEFVYAKVITISVNGKPEDALLYEDFGSPTALDKVVKNGGCDFEKKWLKEYEGEKGVLELTINTSGNLRAHIEPQNHVLQNNYFAIKMWLPNELTTPSKLKFGGDNWATSYWMISADTANERGRWITYFIDISAGFIDVNELVGTTERWFTNTFDSLRTNKCLCINAYGCGAGAKIYIAEMFYSAGIETLGAQVNLTGEEKQYEIITITSTANEGVENLKIVVTNPKGLVTELGSDGKYVPTEVGEHNVTVSAGNCAEVYKTKFNVNNYEASVEQCQDDFFESGADTDEEITPIANTESEICKSFAMNENASIKYGADELGLRFELTLSKADYDYMKLNYNNAEYGIFVIPVDYLENDALSLENLFGLNAKYNWAEMTNNAWTYAAQSGKKRIAKYSTKDLSFNGNGDLHFYGVLNNIKDGTKDATNNLTREFFAVGYVKYVSSEETQYIFTKKTAVSSLAYVAQKELEFENKAILTEKVIDNVGKTTNGTTTKIVPNYSYKTEYYFEQTDGTYLIDESKTTIISALFNCEVNAVVNSVSGYYVNNEEIGVKKSGKVYANGRLTLAVYYSFENRIRLTSPLSEVDGKIDLTGCELYGMLDSTVIDGAIIETKVTYYGSDIPVNDGKFYVENTGEYVITFTCNYGEYEYQLTETFVKAYEKQPNEINSLDSDELIAGIRIPVNTGAVTWKSNVTMNGEVKYGVADVTFSQGYEAQYFSFDLPITVSEYLEAGYDLIGITLAVTDTENSGLIFHYPYQGVDAMAFVKETQLKAQEQWITYLIPFDSGAYGEDGKTALNNYLYRLGKQSYAGKLHLYISEIRAYKSSELVTLSSHSTDEMITLTKATGITNLNVNYACEHTGSVTLNNDTFYASQSSYLISFERTIGIGENTVSSKYILFEKSNAKLATAVAKIGCTTTGELKINNSITWTLTGISGSGSNNAICGGNIELIGPNGKVIPAYGWPTDGATMTFTPTEAGTYKVQMDGWCGSFTGKKIFEYYVSDKELTVSGSHTLNNNVMTLPAPILASIGDTPTTSSFTIKNISVVIGENTFTSTTYDVTISKFGNYTATYVVTGEDGIKYTCTLVGTVSDNNVLTIKNAPSKVELSGTTLTLPTPVLKDADENVMAYTNLQVSLKKSEDSITLTGMTFLAEVGVYKAVYSVEYNGLTYNYTYDFSVVLPFSPVINSFDTAESLSELTLTYPEYDSKRLLPSDEFGDLQYKDGVADITFTYGHISHLFKFNLPTNYSEYVEAGYDLIGITFAVSDISGEFGFDFPSGNGTSLNYVLKNNLKGSNKWITYLVPLYRDAFGADGKTAIKEFNLRRPINNVHLYIDEIRAYKSSELVSFTASTLSTDELITVTNNGVNNLKAYYTSRGDITSEIILDDNNAFYAGMSSFAVSFEKGESEFLLFEKLKSNQVSEVTTISYTYTGELKVNNEIKLTTVGTSFYIDESIPADTRKLARASTTLIDPNGATVALIANENWNETMTFRPAVAGTYKIKIEPANGSFSGALYLDVVITE